MHHQGLRTGHRQHRQPYPSSSFCWSSPSRRWCRTGWVGMWWETTCSALYGGVCGSVLTTSQILSYEKGQGVGSGSMDELELSESEETLCTSYQKARCSWHSNLCPLRTSNFTISLWITCWMQKETMPSDSCITGYAGMEWRLNVYVP